MKVFSETSKSTDLFDYIYDNCINGIPKVSKPVADLADEYIKKYGRTDRAIDKLIKNQVSKNSLNGFMTSFGGFVTMPITLPANITSVIYVQMRMVAAIALIRGFDLKDDEVQTFVYSCMVKNAITDILKEPSIQTANKISLNAVNKISGNSLTKINQKLGFRFITISGTKGTINITKIVPIVGAGVGATIDYTTTKVIANRAKKVFEENNIINLSALDS